MLRKNLGVWQIGRLLTSLGASLGTTLVTELVTVLVTTLVLLLVGFGSGIPSAEAVPVRSLSFERIQVPLPVSAQVGTASEVPPTELIGKLRSRAFAAVRAGEHLMAEQAWSQLLELLPDEAAIWSNRGNSKVALNQLEAAIADFDRAIQLAPDQPDPYLNRGAAWEALKQWDKAIADYNRVIELNPQDAAAYNNRGNAQAGLEQWQAALADYQQAMRLRSNYIYAQANYAIGLYQIGDPTTAIKILKNLARKHPSFADARAALTAALWTTGNQGEAESNWVAVMGLDQRYKNLEWVANSRRWAPVMVTALEKFLTLQ